VQICPNCGEENPDRFRLCGFCGTSLAPDVAVEEVECKDGAITVFAPPAEFYKAKTALLEAFPGLELEIQEIRFLPKASKSLSGEDLGLFERLLNMLNDCDDVQEIYHNVSLP
jgi:transcriptional/translational regulatory protein YebC/TACO1